MSIFQTYAIQEAQQPLFTFAIPFIILFEGRQKESNSTSTEATHFRSGSNEESITTSRQHTISF